MKINVNNPKPRFASERGAALITVLLISVPLLMAGGALIMITSMSAANTADSAAETKAYYAAEAGGQRVLGVLRGNNGPSPLFASNPMGSIAPENQISFKRAVDPTTSNLSTDTNGPRLSRWLTYDSTYDRVPLTDNYSPVNGMAFTASLSDPDNSKTVTFSASGGFPGWGMNDNHMFGGNARISYTGQAQTTITGTGSSTLGSFAVSNFSSSFTLNDEPFTITLTQTAPWPVTVTINCKLSGTISSAASPVVVTFPTISNNLGPVYARASNPISGGPITVTVTAPQPNRLIARINGFGPRAAQKQLQMLVSRFAFDFTSVSTITLRSADDGSLCSFGAGNSSVYLYSGYDNAGGQNLPALGVTSTQDYTYINTLGLPADQTVGAPTGVQQIPVGNLPVWLQTADSTRALVIQLRAVAEANNRYFDPLTPPASFGTASQPVLTFVDGDCALPPAGGAGLLVVTGNFVPDGSAAYDGLILVLGAGTMTRSGGGNGATLGSIIVAKFGTTGNFLAPTFQANGSGNSSMQYDSNWVRRALASPGPRVLAVGEF